ncbi:hypothetical protein Bbelb_120840 [Branchiostoma belcheri]|nr:hypothetical protein Bbelb_120840 [Branchiostoma belcheri]
MRALEKNTTCICRIMKLQLSAANTFERRDGYRWNEARRCRELLQLFGNTVAVSDMWQFYSAYVATPRPTWLAASVRSCCFAKQNSMSVREHHGFGKWKSVLEQSEREEGTD